MLQSVKAQINSLKVVVNDEYLKLVNVTLYKEVIAKHISSSVSQFVLVALARAGMIVISKQLLEMIITKREYLRKQRENTEKQKRIELDDKLKVMQKSTDKQLDDKISGKIDQNVHKTVRTILSTDLKSQAFKANKKVKKSKNTSSSIDGNETTACLDNENKNANERQTQAVPVASNIAALQPPLAPIQQTVLDVNGQQFFLCRSIKHLCKCFLIMLPSMFHLSILEDSRTEGNYGVVEGADVFNGDSNDTQVFLMLIVWILHPLIFLKIKYSQLDYMIFQKVSDLI